MAETDILNADVAWDNDLNDSIGPDYGLDQLRASQLAWNKPAFGDGWARTIGDTGPSTTLSWLNRSQRCAEYIMRWAEQFEDDYFTIIDHAFGRHYVGRFEGDIHKVEAGNDRYNIQGVTFRVVPGAPMVEYPSEWDRWAISQRPFYGANNLRMACYAAAPNVWARPAAVNGVAPNQVLLTDASAGDSVTHEYLGYGFRLWCQQGPQYGRANLLIDGGQVALINFNNAEETGPQIVYANAQMPWGLHRLQLVSDGTVTAGAAHNTIVLDHVEVMR